MAIYHLSHKSVGRSTHAAGTAGAHADYITRATACDLLIGEHMPIPDVGSRGGPARKWLDEQEAADRKNARVIDKLTLALPHELNPEQQVQLVRDFANSMTNGEAPYLAAFHRLGKDASNQHCHLILRDRHVETGKRVWGNEKRKTTEVMREKWEQVCNDALEQIPNATRIDRRTLKVQGIEREPQKHAGPVAKAIEDDGRVSWKLDALREEKRISEARKRVVESRGRALDPNGLGKAPAMKFLRKATPRKEINKGTAIFLQNARFLERLWEFSTAVKDETLRFAEDAYRASASMVRSFVLPNPAAMTDEDRFKERGRLEIIAQLRERSEGALYAVIDQPDRLSVLNELPVGRHVSALAIDRFAESLRQFRNAQIQDWHKTPAQADTNTLIAALDHTMSARTKPSAQYRYSQSSQPTGLAHDSLGLSLNDFVPLLDLQKAWEARQQDPDMIALNNQITKKHDRQSAWEAADDRRLAVEWEEGRPTREAKAEAARERQRAAGERQEVREAQIAQEAADEAHRATVEATERQRVTNETCQTETKAEPKPKSSNSNQSGPSI